MTNSTGTRGLHRLTAQQVAGATIPDGKNLKRITDGAGLTLLLKRGSTGIGKYWQLRFRDPVTKKEQIASLGTYPEVGLAKARQKAQEVRDDLIEGIAPRDREQMQLEEIATRRKNRAHTFETVARSWWQECCEDGLWKSQDHQNSILRSLELHAFPKLGDNPIREVTAAEIRAVVRRIGQAGSWDMATRVLQRIRSVYEWAEDMGHVEAVPTRPAQRWIKRTMPEEAKGCNYPHLPPSELPELAQAIDDEHEFMDRQTWLALQVQALSFVRPGELRHAKWTDIDLEEQLWTVPAEYMKMKREHLVPISAPMLDALIELRELNSNRVWVFPGRTRPRYPMSDGTLSVAIKRLRPDEKGKGAFVGRHTAHGFRHTASTYLNDYREGDLYPYRGDPVELQLAHLDRDKVRRAYNKATLLPLRREMMEIWGELWLSCRGVNEATASAQEAHDE